MATVAEKQWMKVSAFVVGSDTYSGITAIQLERVRQPTYGVRLEGELRPSRLEAIETDEPPVRFTVRGSSAAMDALSNTSAATFTVTVRDVTHASNTRVITVTLPTFEAFSAGAQNRSVDGATLSGTATDFADAAP